MSLCITEQVGLLLIAGDVFDGEWRDYATGLFFASQMAKLHEANVRVVWLRGNHDAACRLTKHLELPSVHELPCNEPGTVRLEELGIFVHGQGFESPAITRDLAARYPSPIRGAMNIGLLHSALEGREGHAPYAPCRLEALVNKGYAYWALGHVHERAVLHQAPWVVFSGNLQGRHVREAGAKGATLVTVEDDVVRRVEHRSLDVVRYRTCTIDATGLRSPDEVLDSAVRALDAAAEECEGTLLAARVVVRGATAAHRDLEAGREQFVNQIRGAALYLRAANVWIEKVLLATRAELDLPALRSREDAVGQLSRAFADLRRDPSGVAELWQGLADVHNKLPSEFGRERSGAAPEDPEALARLLDDVEQLLLPRLVAGDKA